MKTGLIGTLGSIVTLAAFNTILGTITGILTFAFIVYKWYKEVKGIKQE